MRQPHHPTFVSAVKGSPDAGCGNGFWRCAGLLRGWRLWTYGEPGKLRIVREGLAVLLYIKAPLMTMPSESVVLLNQAVEYPFKKMT